MQKLRFYLTLMVAAFLTIGSVGCSAKMKAEYNLKRETRFFNAGQYDKAEVEYINVLRNNQTNAEAISHLGIIYFDEGRLHRAAPFVLKGTQLLTNDLDLHLKLGSIYLAIGQLKKAHDAAVFVLNRKPQDDAAPILLVQSVRTKKEIEDARQRFQQLLPEGNKAALDVALGTLSFYNGDLKSAEASFENARTLNPKFAAAYAALGALHWAQKDLKQAEADFKTAADLSPERSPRRLQYAQFEIQTGKIAAGKTILENMVKNTPNYVPAWLELAQIALAEKKFDDCTASLNKVLARDPDNLEALLASSKVELAQGKIAGATADLEKLANVYAQVPAVQYQLAVAYLAGNETDKAVASLNRALSSDTNYPDALLLLADIQIKTGRVDPAIVSLKQLSQQNPQIVQARLLLANAYRIQGDFATALDIYQQLEADYPTNFEIPLLMGTTYVQQKNNVAARQAFTRALNLSPDNFTVLEYLVNLDLREKQFTSALERVQLSMTQNPKLAAPYILQAQILTARGDTNQAEAALLKSIKLQPDIENSHMLLARIYMDSKQNQKALAELKIAAKVNTNDLAPIFITGMILNDEKDYKDARDAYEKVLTLNPKFSPALNNLAYLYAEYLNNLDRAYELAQRARYLLPNDPATADTLGWILCKRGQYASALALLQESASRLPNEPEVQYHLGKVNYLMGNADAARLAFQRALRSGHEFRGKDECDKCMAVLSVDVKTAGTEAQKLLEKQAVEHPDDSIALLRLAAIYQRDGLSDKAVGAYESTLKGQPNNVTALINLAKLYAPKDLPKAFDLANDAYKLAPDAPGVPYILGQLAYQKGNYELAYSLLQTASQNQPGNSNVFYDYAKAAYSIGKVSEAQNAMRSALQSGGSFPTANEARRFLNLTALMGNSAQALTAAPQVRDVLKSEPDYVPALVVQAEISQQQNDVNHAKQMYLKILAQYPDFAPAQKSLAILLAENNDNDSQAYGLATKARAAYPGDPSVAKALGIILYRQTDYPRAERLLKESAAKLDGDPEIFYYLGMAQYHLKIPAECKKNLQHALKLNLPNRFIQEAKQVLIELK